ncbi:MAG: type II secretion system protein [Oscillospiraceae bacterium]|nr:type II secretion system protein [Oscillospiraceae bacterium]
MNKKFKAFTLIELLVVIVIFGIIMSGLMNFFKPLRQTYVDSTLYEQQRTAQNGIIEYLCESTRYAEHMIIYDSGAKGSQGKIVGSVEQAVDDFSTNYELEADEKGNIRVIVINRGASYDENGKYLGAGSVANGYQGRIITNYLEKDASGKYIDTWKHFMNGIGQRTQSNTGYTYMALGGGYYGASDYSIFIDYDRTYPGGTYAGGITFTVQNALRNTGNVVESGYDIGGSSLTVKDDAVVVTTSQANRTPNMLSGVTYYTVVAKSPAGSISPTGSITNATTNTYIVYTVPEEDQR